MFREHDPDIRCGANVQLGCEIDEETMANDAGDGVELDCQLPRIGNFSQIDIKHLVAVVGPVELSARLAQHGVADSFEETASHRHSEWRGRTFR